MIALFERILPLLPHMTEKEREAVIRRTEAEQRTREASTVARARILLRSFCDADVDETTITLPYEDALWWLMTAEQTLNGERPTELHALIAGSVDHETLLYVVRGSR